MGMHRRLAFLILWMGFVLSAHAVTVRGHVTTTLGQPLAGARVQLIQLSGGPHNAADAITDVDGSYELLSDASGRFLLITSPPLYAFEYAPQIGNQFYGGRNDVLTMDIALNAGEITQQASAQAGLTQMPMKEISDPPKQVAADTLLTQASIIPELRPVLGASVVQLGQFGTPAMLYLHGAPVGKTVVDGVSAEMLGGGFNLSTATSAGLAAVVSTPAIELSGGPHALYGLDAGTGIMSLTTARAESLHPTLTYTGDAGNLSTSRNDAVFSIVHKRSDALLEFARFNSDNDLPSARMHQVTEAANLGYSISGNTTVRLTLRNEVDAAPIASSYGFYGVAPKTKLASQNLIGGFTFETRTAGEWHNVLRYGLVRDRTQAYNYSTPTAGVPLTIVGANGASASGTATFLPMPAREDAVTNRDEYGWQTDYRFRSWLNVVGTARFQDERGADVASTFSDRLSRKHLTFAAVLTGEIKHRFFYDASGFLDRVADAGLHGAPRIGMKYVAVPPGLRKFRGTSLHLTVASGVREQTVLETALLSTAYSPKARSVELGIEQNILPKKLDFRANFFHAQYSHQTEVLGLAPLKLSNTLAYRAQGLEAEVRYNPAPRLLMMGGYTFMGAVVERSASTAAVNPNLPETVIGATTALVGARPFDRPSNTGFVAVEYSGTKLELTLKATLAGKSDGTTGLVLNPTMLLPNRDLSPRYAAVDASVGYTMTNLITVFSQLTNLLDDRHIAPIGYLSTPFAVRVGVRLRLGRE